MRSENKSNSRERVHKLYIESEYKYLICVLFVQRHYTECFPYVLWNLNHESKAVQREYRKMQLLQ